MQVTCLIFSEVAARAQPVMRRQSGDFKGLSLTVRRDKRISGTKNQLLPHKDSLVTQSKVDAKKVQRNSLLSSQPWGEEVEDGHMFQACLDFSAFQNSLSCNIRLCTLEKKKPKTKSKQTNKKQVKQVVRHNWIKKKKKTALWHCPNQRIEKEISAFHTLLAQLSYLTWTGFSVENENTVQKSLKNTLKVWKRAKETEGS